MSDPILVNIIRGMMARGVHFPTAAEMVSSDPLAEIREAIAYANILGVTVKFESGNFIADALETK